MTKAKPHGLNLLFIKRLGAILWAMSRPFSPAFLILLLVIPASITEQVAVYYMGLVPSGFYTVLETRDLQGFYKQLYNACWWVLAVVLVKCSKTFAAGALYIQWRWSLTSLLHRRYFAYKAYYHVNCISGNIDNPDMRITQDVDRLITVLQSIVLQIIVFPAVVAYYTYKCWDTMGYIGPACIYGYFLVSCVVNKLLMSPIVNLVFHLEEKEGHLRFVHMNLRAGAESAAFSDAHASEEEHFNTTLKEILHLKQLIIFKQLLLNLAVNGCDYIGAILSYIILAIPIFAGAFDNVAYLGSTISKNSFVAMYLVYSFSTMIDLSSKIADLAGYTHRVGELMEYVIDIKPKPDDISGLIDDTPLLKFDDVSQSFDEHEMKPGELLKLTSVTITNPITNKTLVKNLYFTVSTGTNVLIQGPPGSGKTSIKRVIKGLWSPLCGKITTAHNIKILHLPQKPYFSQRSLRSQISFPALPLEEDDVFIKCLERLDLLSVLDETVFKQNTKPETSLRQRFANRGKTRLLDEEISLLDRIPEKSWYDILSPGKLQLLAFARVLYHTPHLVLLDEATSAVSPELAGRMYGMLKELGIGYASVGHSVSLEQYHDVVIVMGGDGESWSVKDTGPLLLN